MEVYMPGPFTVQVATTLIRENPGWSAQEIVRDALSRGIIGSKGRYPIAGQAGALVKMYIGGRLPEVQRNEQQRPYRYYPKGAVYVQPPSKPTSEPITFRPTQRQEEILTALTETKKFSSRSEAVHWLLDKGIASKQGDISKIMETYREIERMQREVQQIGQ